MHVVVLPAIGAAMLDAVGTGASGPLAFRERVRVRAVSHAIGRCEISNDTNARTPGLFPKGRGEILEAGLTGQLHQFAMNVEPFPNAIERQEVLPAGLAKLTARELRFQLVIEVPELQIADEIGLGIGQQGVAGVGRLLLLQRPFARVLHAPAPRQ